MPYAIWNKRYKKWLYGTDFRCMPHRQILDFYYLLQQNHECEHNELSQLLSSMRMGRFSRAMMYVMERVFGLEKDKMIRRTGITHNGWSRIVVDDKEYYIPGDKVSTDIPDSLPIADGIKGEYQKYALSLLPEFGWDSSELVPLINLWNRESGWNPNSHNKRSGAHGIPQALPGSKMASEGSDYYTNAEPQIRWGLKYIAGRYGSPSAAWAHWQSRGWY